MAASWVNTSVDTMDLTMLKMKQQQNEMSKRLSDLMQGQSVIILSYQDPQFIYLKVPQAIEVYFSWEYLEKGPVLWKVVVRKNRVDEGPSLGELVASDIRIADIFLKYCLDFCCGGKKSLAFACKEKQLDLNKIESELKNLDQIKQSGKAVQYNRWKLDFLVDYIFNEHHLYWYNEENAIAELMTKVVNHHGKNYPMLYSLGQLFETLKAELNVHFKIEEQVLFPYIKELAKLKDNLIEKERMVFITIANPIQMMEIDHEAAGALLAEMRKVTDGYELPKRACNSFQLLFHKLQNLESDLHQHIHLENNILFPKALLLQNEILKNETKKINT